MRPLNGKTEKRSERTIIQRAIRIVLVLLCVLKPSLLLAATQEILIKHIDIHGHWRSDTQTLLSTLGIRSGDVFSPPAVSDAIKKLYALNYFDQITVESDPFEGGIALTFVVSEKPALAEITFEGNDAIPMDQLREKLEIKPGDLADKKAIDQAVEKIVALYKKEAYYQAKVTPMLHRLSERTAGLTFLISEGEKAYIRNIAFDGNAAFADKELKKSITTREYFWLTSWFTESGRYQDNLLEEDADRLSDFYLNRGYLQVKVGKPRVSVDVEHIDIVFPISEGEPWKIEKIAYQGNARFDDTALSGATKSQAGAMFSKKQIREDIQAMLDLYGRSGYLFARVDPQIIQNPEQHTVSVIFLVEEGNVIRVRAIDIRGNDRTRDKVIRREMRQTEQEQVNTDALRRSFQRIHNLNFFEKMDIVPHRVNDDEVDLSVTVTEKSTGSLTAGAGYDSIYGVVGQFAVSQENLAGRGQLLRVSAEFGKKRDAYTLTFREPYLWDSSISGTANIYNQNRVLESYREQRIGGSLAAGKSFGEHIRAQLNVTREKRALLNVQSHAPRFVQDQARLGETLTHAVGFSLTRDTRDFMFDPKEGAEHLLTLEYAGTFLGGDNDYYKITLESGRFFPAWRDHVFSLHGAVGFAEGIGAKTLPAGERFFIGGINTVRGFSFGRAGPLDQDVIKGGNKQLFLNAEYLIPLIPEAKLKGVLFYDYGKGFDDAEPIQWTGLRHGAGVGIRWVTPMGPLRFERGHNLRPLPGEPKVKYDFTIGTLF